MELKRLHQSHKETFRNYREDIQKNFIEALPNWRSNLILQAQVASGLLDLSKVNFDFLKDISTVSLKFDVYHPKSDEWEAFQSGWKQSSVFSIPTMPGPEANKGSLVYVEQNPEAHPQTDEVPIKPLDQSSKGGN